MKSRVKRIIAVVMVVLAVILGANLALAVAANAAPQTSNSTSVGVAKAAPTFVTESVTPVTSAPSVISKEVQAPTLVGPQALVAPSVIGGGVVKPLWRYTSCYWNMFGNYMCYRYACTYFERIVYGCYDGYVNMYRPVYV